jgi:hypothetical protein
MQAGLACSRKSKEPSIAAEVCMRKRQSGEVRLQRVLQATKDLGFDAE